MFALAGPAIAQEIAGTITGSVQDQTGAQIPAAAVVARNVDTGIAYKATATEAGMYVLPLLPAGNYQISAETQGFKRFVRDGLSLAPDQRLRVDIRLELGSLSEQVVVRAETPLVTTDQSNTGGNFEPSQADSLPVGRAMATLLQLIPGVQAGGNGYWVGNINGSQESTTDFKVDGVPATNNNNGLTTATPMLELVEQVVVHTSDFSAEFGRGATQVQVTTRSGANQFRGTLFEYFGNAKLDASPFMSNVYGFPKPVTNGNTFGGTVSGPVLLPGIYNGRNRTFFTFGYQGNRNREYKQIVSSVPLAAMRAGDFSGGAIIYDPATTRPSGTGNARDAFPGNRIPAERMDPVAVKVMEIGFPLPNQPGANNNYVNSGSDRAPADAFNTRGDHNISDRSRLTARYLYRRVFNNRLQTFNNPAGAGGGSNFLRKNVFNQSASADHVLTLRPNLVNNLHFGHFRMTSPADTLGVNEDWAGKIGLKNVGPDKFPQMKVNALTTLGGGAFSRQVPANTYQFSESLLAIAGRHSIKGGVEYRKLEYSTWNSGSNSGQFNFNQQPTANVGTQKQGIGFASFLLGIPNGASVTLQESDGFVFRWNAYSTYLQDDYRVTNRLTLNLGFRWEAESPRRESKNRQSDFNLKTLTLDYAGQNGYPETLHDGNWFNFAPRVGFAYSLARDSRTVVRGAYGVFYLTANTEEGQTNFTTGPWNRTYSFASLNSGVSFPITLRNGLPAMSFNDPFTLSLLTGVAWLPRTYPTGYMQQWNINIQRDIRGTLLQTGYSGTKGTHLRLTYDLNQVPVNLIGPGESQSRRPYPAVGGITGTKSPVGGSTYHAVQSRFERRPTRGARVLRQLLPRGGSPFRQRRRTGVLEEARHPRAQAGQLAGVPRVRDDVAPFPGVGLEVEQFAGPPFGAFHVLQVAGADAAHVFVLEADFVAPRRRFAAEEPGVAAADPPAVRGNRHTGIVQDGGEEVVRGDHGRGRLPRANPPRLVPDQRDVQRLLVHVQRQGGVPLAPQTVVPRAVALVRGEHDYRVVPQPELIQPADHPAHVPVHGRDQRAVGELPVGYRELLLAAVGGPGVHGLVGQAGETSS